MEQDAPVASGIGSFAKAFGDTVARGSENQGKEQFKAWLDQRNEKQKATDKKNYSEDPHKVAPMHNPKDQAGTGKINQQDKNFIQSFRIAQAKVNAAIQHYADTHSNIMTNPTGFQKWQSESQADKNNEIADAFDHGELSGLKNQHDMIYNLDNIARFAKLNGMGATATTPPSGGDNTVNDLMTAPPIQGNAPVTAPGPQSMGPKPPITPQGQPPTQMAQAPMPQPKAPMQPPMQMAQAQPFKLPPATADGKVGSFAPSNAMVPGQGPSTEDSEEELDNTPTV